MIRIGTRISADWLDRPDDLKFIKQIGVDYVDIVLDMVPGYNEAGGRATREDLAQVIENLNDVGLKIERANAICVHYANAFLGLPGGEREIENFRSTPNFAVKPGYRCLASSASRQQPFTFFETNSTAGFVSTLFVKKGTEAS